MLESAWSTVNLGDPVEEVRPTPCAGAVSCWLCPQTQDPPAVPAVSSQFGACLSVAPLGSQSLTAGVLLH